ncbi:hypothetical protein V2W30_40065 (plasmid) [Streptomyces sp. Q6]|uniref:Uncharacterized protein n=1 Tax=Streptomyces citrinus TaxID=3118173 RepID=A0ACD5AQ35_9ACTN
MRTVIKAAVTAASAVLLLAPASSSAPMSGSDTEQSVSISVKGRGLHVDSIIVSSDKQRNGEAFRVYRHTGYAANQAYVTRWKKAEFVDAGMTHFSMTSWKINKNFADGTWLCAESAESSGNPCIKVHK